MVLMINNNQSLYALWLVRVAMQSYSPGTPHELEIIIKVPQKKNMHNPELSATNLLWMILRPRRSTRPAYT
jgi:hypothetical protein